MGLLLFFPMAQQPLVGQGLLIIEASRSHSVGLLWASDQPAAETSTGQPIAASERSQTHALHRAATLGLLCLISLFITLYAEGVTVCILVSINYLLIASGNINSR